MLRKISLSRIQRSTRTLNEKKLAHIVSQAEKDEFQPYPARILNMSPPLYVLPSQTKIFSGPLTPEVCLSASQNYLDQGWIPPYGCVLPPSNIVKEIGTILVCDMESIIDSYLDIAEIRERVGASGGLVQALTKNVVMMVINFLRDFHQYFDFCGVCSIFGRRPSSANLIEHPQWSVERKAHHKTLRQAVTMASEALGIPSFQCTDPLKTRSTALFSVYRECTRHPRNVVIMTMSRVALSWLHESTHHNLRATTIQYNPQRKIFIRPRDIMDMYKVPQSKVRDYCIFSKCPHIGRSKAHSFVTQGVNIHECGAPKPIINHYEPSEDSAIVDRCKKDLTNSAAEMLFSFRSFAQKRKLHVSDKFTFYIKLGVREAVKDLCGILSSTENN